MPNYYAQTTINAATGETADASSNVFAAISDHTLLSLDATAWATAITDFYADCLAVGAMSGYATAGDTAKFLVADGIKPNYPLFERGIGGWGTPGSIEMPLEVALCASYANDSFTTVPRARRRGRIYISGWTEAANTAGRPTTTVYEGLAQAYADYVAAVNAISGMTAGIWSRITSDVYPVERVWADNEWDTMRSRGGKSTVRKTITI